MRFLENIDLKYGEWFELLWKVILSTLQLFTKKWRVSDFQLISQLIYIINHYSIQVHPSLSACIRIPWVLDPKNVRVENFWVRSVLPKKHFFTNFCVTTKKNVWGSCVYMFRHTPKLPWCQPFGVYCPGPSKVR